MEIQTQIVTERIPEKIERFVREEEREHITGVSRVAWWRLEAEGLAPRRIRIHTRTIAWKLSDLQRWVELRSKGEEWGAAP